MAPSTLDLLSPASASGNVGTVRASVNCSQPSVNYRGPGGSPTTATPSWSGLTCPGGFNVQPLAEGGVR